MGGYIDLREDPLVDLQIAAQMGQGIGNAFGTFRDIKQKKLQQFRDEETQKAVVNIASDPNITSAQALQKLKGIKDAVNVKLTEYDKMLIQQAEYIRQQNAAIAPQVKSQMFEAARGGQAGAVDQYGAPDMAQTIQNVGVSAAGQAREDLMKPQEKYGIKPWWMHPDYKDTPEGQAAQAKANYTYRGRSGIDGKPLTPSEENALNKQLTELEALMNRAETPEDVEYYRQQMNNIYGKLGVQPKSSQFTEPQAVDLFKKIIVGDGDKAKGIGKGKGRATEGETMAAMNKIVAQLMAKGLTRQQANEFAVKQYDAMIEDDNSLIGDSRLPKGKTGKDFIRQAPQEAQQGQGYGNRVDGTPKGSGWLGEIPMTDGSNRVMTELSVGVEFDGKEIQIPLIVPTLTQKEVELLASGKNYTPEILNKAVEFAKQRLNAGQSPFNTTGSGSGNGNTQDIGGGNEDLEAIRWAKANPNDPRAIQILQLNGIK